MAIRHRSHPPYSNPVPSELFRMPEFDSEHRQRSVGDILRDSLEDAEAQLRLQRRRARRAEQRTRDLDRAVNNWHEMIEEYERSPRSTVGQHRN
jgi:hypothetical protein